LGAHGAKSDPSTATSHVAVAVHVNDHDHDHVNDYDMFEFSEGVWPALALRRPPVG
jgi:hypothetical protein